MIYFCMILITLLILKSFPFSIIFFILITATKGTEKGRTIIFIIITFYAFTLLPEITIRIIFSLISCKRIVIRMGGPIAVGYFIATTIRKAPLLMGELISPQR